MGQDLATASLVQGLRAGVTSHTEHLAHLSAVLPVPLALFLQLYYVALDQWPSRVLRKHTERVRHLFSTDTH